MPRPRKSMEDKSTTIFVKVPNPLYWELEKLISSNTNEISKEVLKMLEEFVENRKK